MFLWFTGYILIPVSTVLFALDSNWFTTNFSVIGNQIGRNEEFVLWGLIVGIYFFECLRQICTHMERRQKGLWMIPVSLVLLVAAITTPYLPDQLPLKAFLHVVFAFMSAVCLMLSLLLIVWGLYRQNQKKYRPYLISLAGIALVSVILLWLAGIVSSALEIFFTITSAILVQRLYRSFSLPGS